MKKIKIGISFILFVIVCILAKQISLFVNYILALIFHELAHLWVALKSGYTLKIIKLDMFGMSLNLNETIDDKDSFKINIAGPICNLIISIMCVALYWLIPNSYNYLNTFCVSNLVLALFNLLPVYPLDGGKIFRSLIKSDKAYRILDGVIRCIVAVIAILIFVATLQTSPNILLVIIAIFFILCKGPQKPTMSIFKFKRNKHFDNVVIFKIDESETLFNLLKKIKNYNYTIFYIPSIHQYYNEDEIVNMSLKYPLTTQIKNISKVI